MCFEVVHFLLMLTIVNDYSHRVWPYFLKHKSDAFESFKAWKVMVEK
jgi:hypothetical protein